MSLQLNVGVATGRRLVSTIGFVRVELALGGLGTSRLTSTQSLGWKGLSTESMLRPLVSTSLGGEPAYPISELRRKD